MPVWGSFPRLSISPGLRFCEAAGSPADPVPPAFSASHTRNHLPCSQQVFPPDPLMENGLSPEKHAMEPGVDPHWKNPDEEKAVSPLCAGGRHFQGLRIRCPGILLPLASPPTHGCSPAPFPVYLLLRHEPISVSVSLSSSKESLRPFN